MDSLVLSTVLQHQSTGTTSETLAQVPVKTTRETLVWCTEITTRRAHAGDVTTTGSETLVG